jgi:hypothetical protein
MNITIFITTLITSLASTVFYETPANINSQVRLEKQEKKMEYVIKTTDIPVLGVIAFNDKTFSQL